jgi:catechol 2,3-dioxygenase-like lactoylglutathione lyase family enzyme
MTVELDHTIVCTVDPGAAIEFYTSILGFTHAGSVGSFEVIRINDRLAFDLEKSEQCSSRHFAFVMDADTFDATFARIRESGVVYGDGPGRRQNMRGPGRSTGTRGATHSVYFDDPDGHILEILTYATPGGGQ